MPNFPDSLQPPAWHRYFAAACNNAAWDLASRPGRSAGEDRDLLYNAYAAAYHWSVAGEPVHQARAEVTLAHAHALLGHGDLALHYARRCLQFFENNPVEDWDLAFAHLEMVLAARANGDDDLYRQHYERARQLGEAIQEEEDRMVFLDELARVPEPE